ncbi:MAG: CPBP family intramembrane metalloprotease, partial [Dietzia sp.]|nr:CPBP family intramembrane metalloprotease [Dietzia sp.]
PPARTPLHLVWQIPAVMLAGVAASMVVLVPLGAGPEGSDDGLEDLATGGPAFVVLGLLAVAVLVPVAEEVVFRGIVLPALRARFRAVPGIALAGAVFAAVHLIPPALPYLVVVGISLCVMAQWYRSIVPGIVLHGVNNAVVFAGIVAAGSA